MSELIVDRFKLIDVQHRCRDAQLSLTDLLDVYKRQQLNYALPIWVKDRTQLYLSGWMRASRNTPVRLMLRYQKQDGTLVKEEQIALTLSLIHI